MFGHGDDIPLHFCYDGVVSLNDCEIGVDHFLDRGVFEAFHDTFSVLGLGNAAQEIGEIVLAPGILDMGIELCPFSHEVIASSEQVSGCSHLGRVDIGHGDHATFEECSDFVRVDLVVFGFAAVDGFHVEGMAQDEGDALLSTEVGDPVPGEHALHGNDDVLSERLNGFEEDIPIGLDVAVEHDFSGAIKDAEVHFLGVKVDSAIILVLFGVKSHVGFLLWFRMFSVARGILSCLRRRP